MIDFSYEVDRLKAELVELRAQIAAKDARIAELEGDIDDCWDKKVDAHQELLAQIAAKDAALRNIAEYTSPLHSAGEIARAALSQPATAQGCEHCKDYIGKCPYCHSERPGIPAPAQEDKP